MWKRFTLLLRCAKWIFKGPDSARILVSDIENGAVLILCDLSRVSIPAFYVIDDSNRPVNEPFQKRYPDGEFGWCIRNSNNGYFHLGPVITGIFERDRAIYSTQPVADMEPNVG
jgi:hypothetical protein